MAGTNVSRETAVNGPPPKPQAHRQPVRAGLRLPRAARLLRHADFERVYEQGQRHFARHMTFFFLPATASGARVGFTVGRVLGGAVERNRIKRRLREATRLQGQRLEAAADVVVNPKKSVLHAEFTEIMQEVGRAFEVISGKLRNSERKV